MISYEMFRQFLRNEKCEEAFDQAFYIHNDSTYLDEQIWVAIGDYTSIFARVFSWKNSIEGPHFWREIDNKWRTTIRDRTLPY